jgi:hypothetical protein
MRPDLLDPVSRLWTTRSDPVEGDIVALRPDYVRGSGLPAEYCMARGRLTLIEHEKGEAFACVTWDYPGIEDRMSITQLVRARDLFRTR